MNEEYKVIIALSQAETRMEVVKALIRVANISAHPSEKLPEIVKYLSEALVMAQNA